MTTKTLEIIKYPNEILRNQSEPVEINDKETLEILQQMRKYVMEEENNALGLSLPQVGVNKRGFVATLEGKTDIIINPKIIQKSQKVILDTEGCLSIDEKNEGMVPRSLKISIIYRDHQFKMKKRVLKGMDARVFLHEFDHLDGILYIDRIKEVKN